MDTPVSQMESEVHNEKSEKKNQERLEILYKETIKKKSKYKERAKKYK